MTPLPCHVITMVIRGLETFRGNYWITRDPGIFITKSKLFCYSFFSVETQGIKTFKKHATIKSYYFTICGLNWDT